MLSKANTSLQNAIERIQAHSTQETLMLERVQLHVSVFYARVYTYMYIHHMVCA
jgi:hypothetical protein